MYTTAGEPGVPRVPEYSSEIDHMVVELGQEDTAQAPCLQADHAEK